MLGQVLIVDLDSFFSWGLLVETKFISTNMLTRLSYYNVTTRLVNLVVLVETKFSGQKMLGQVLIVDLDYFLLVGVCWLKQN